LAGSIVWKRTTNFFTLSVHLALKLQLDYLVKFGSLISAACNNTTTS